MTSSIMSLDIVGDSFDFTLVREGARGCRPDIYALPPFGRVRYRSTVQLLL